ncbi:glutathione S-transferase [Photobacterium rosenbergii]|uniref:Glutathione S-transferase n=1 Tax=Photobacterium rosenbergii TaxID=294936 RepID=A0A2T3NFS9_9GAMM|nr:glutathione S-transferase [Photobacterium rosenbergii]PSW13410.1 glutathione S-transferase [Photobacterium rosenbergii]
MSLPILYSLRRCPYCIRARLAILMAQQPVKVRDVVTRNLPVEMLQASPKGTVPVLVINKSEVVDESLDIMLWALKQNDPLNLLLSDKPLSHQTEMISLIYRNDNDFVPSLDKYKIAARYHHNNALTYRQECEQFISTLEYHLAKQTFLMGERPSLVDYAVLPFIRQFSRVDRKWYLGAPYSHLERWLNTHYQNPLYSKAMTQYPRWLDTKQEFLIGNV